MGNNIQFVARPLFFLDLIWMSAACIITRIRYKHAWGSMLKLQFSYLSLKHAFFKIDALDTWYSLLMFKCPGSLIRENTAHLTATIAQSNMCRKSFNGSQHAWHDSTTSNVHCLATACSYKCKLAKINHVIATTNKSLIEHSIYQSKNYVPSIW